MTRNRSFVIILVLIILSAFIYVMKPEMLARRFPFAERPYTAVYERNHEGEISTFTISCDGKGHKVGIGEWSPIQGVNDYVADLHFVRLENDKKVMFRNLIGSDYSADEWSIKEGPNVAYVGEKTIDGHQCRGWDMSGKFVQVSPQTDSVYFWYDKETGCFFKYKSLHQSLVSFADVRRRLLRTPVIDWTTLLGA